MSRPTNSTPFRNTLAVKIYIRLADDDEVQRGRRYNKINCDLKHQEIFVWVGNIRKCRYCIQASTRSARFIYFRRNRQNSQDNLCLLSLLTLLTTQYSTFLTSITITEIRPRLEHKARYPSETRSRFTALARSRYDNSQFNISAIYQIQSIVSGFARISTPCCNHQLHRQPRTKAWSYQSHPSITTSLAGFAVLGARVYPISIASPALLSDFTISDKTRVTRQS